MLHQSQFNISSILVATLFVAILLGFYQYWLVVVLVIEIALLFVSVELLVRQLPASVKKALWNNCRRADGSLSTRRQGLEQNAVRKLRSEVWMVFLLVVLPLNVLLWFAFSDWTKSTSALANMSIGKDESAWQSSHFQLMAIGLAVVWVAIAALIVRSGYRYFVRRFAIELQQRTQQNMFRDLHLASMNPNANLQMPNQQ